MTRTPTLAAAAAMAALALPAAAQDPTEGRTSGAIDVTIGGETLRTATADMRDDASRNAGTVTLHEGPNGVLVVADLRNLPPGPHGFHIHETGDCTPFSDAGGHFAPDGASHGLMSEDGPHAGDLPNVHVVSDGSAKASHFTDRLTLDPEAEATLMDDDGAAVIVHGGPDDYADGDSAGSRIACGVIEAEG